MDAAGPRPMSGVFKSRQTDGISVHREHLTTVELIAGRFPYDGIVAVSADLVRSIGCEVRPDPIRETLDEVGDASHALITPVPTSGQARQLAKAANWVREPRIE